MAQTVHGSSRPPSLSCSLSGTPCHSAVLIVLRLWFRSWPKNLCETVSFSAQTLGKFQRESKHGLRKIGEQVGNNRCQKPPKTVLQDARKSRTHQQHSILRFVSQSRNPGSIPDAIETLRPTLFPRPHGAKGKFSKNNAPPFWAACAFQHFHRVEGTTLFKDLRILSFAGCCAG